MVLNMTEKTSYELALESILSQEELEKEINERIDKFQGLLTRDAALKLIAKERGLLKQENLVFKINEIPKSGRKISFSGKILRILPSMKYNNGKISRTVIVGDETGKVKIKLWAGDLDLFSKFKLGDTVEVKNAYEKNDELSLGYSGEIKVIAASSFITLSSLTPSSYVNIKARVTNVEGERSYTKDGKSKQFFAFSISDGTTEKRCVIWEGIGRGSKINIGDEIILENAYVKGSDIYIYGSGRILLRPSNAGGLVGKIEKIECNGEQMIILLNGKSVELDRAEALKLLGVDVAEDISLESIVNLKKEVLLNKNLSITK